MLARVAADFVDGGGTDAATGRVDHAQRAHIVVGIDHELKIGRDVADLGAVEEARAAHDLIGHTGTQEHVFEHAGLGVGAVEDRDVVVARTAVVELLDLRANPAALVTLVVRLIETDLVAVAPVGEEALGLATRVVRDHGVGCGEDMTGGAIVLLELDDARLGIVLLEGEDVLDVGTAPAVDGLVVIAHDHEVLVLGREQVGDRVLDVVGVLILVHADLAETILVALEHVRVLGEQLIGLDQQVVEVHRVGAGKAALEHGIHASGLAGERVVVPRGLVGHLLGRDHRVFRLGDTRADRLQRELLGVDIELGHD